MASSEQCRARAKECVEQAQSAKSPQREQLLKMAQDWLLLADQADETARLRSKADDIAS